MHHDDDIPQLDVMLIDDHALFAEGVRELLFKILPSGSEISLFSSVAKAKESLQTRSYRVVITDLVMPGQNVLDFIAYCHRNYSETVILVISSVIEASSIKACLTAGANGYMSKAIRLNEIRLALECTLQGRKYVSSDLSGRLADSILSMENTTLTNKELEVLRLIAGGIQTKKIADMLHVSPVTIITHKRNILRKLNLHSATELVKYAFENNLV